MDRRELKRGGKGIKNGTRRKRMKKRKREKRNKEGGVKEKKRKGN